ncbi:50S ribosome-binding GTPase domain-containing protein [Ditylenchus destructor]|uniref:50S ribosome-binding GTPase domain-containing protein n=1 Tax=Ditylenchus destructor TaxID=166010 RepID=A0AAD4RDW6_9BILA|nr:50S ribosome-binding GTPase domain-containing protein [Ditylenchus destructor]
MSGRFINPVWIFRRFCSSGPSVVSSAKENTFVPRQSFDLPASFDKKSWFPMHMAVQLKRMEGKLRTVDLVVEVHDARVAITGRNPVFAKQLYAIRPHILVLNKKDLIDLVKYKQPIEDFYHRQGIEHVIWTNCKDSMSRNAAIKNLQDVIKDHLQNMQRFNRTVKTEYQIMVVGIPNVGKSSLINTLRFSNLNRGKAVEEGSRPGVTVRVQNRVRLLDKPPIYVLDTPGILYPHFDDVDSGMKLGIRITLI